MLIVLTTTATREEAGSLAEKIVEQRLGACVQILPQMTSVYVWESKTQTETEHLILIKTLHEKWEALRDFITANHSYTVPEIVAIETEKVSLPYLEWVKEILK